MQLAPSVQQLPIRFVGSGSEYFRIWIVNLLLTIVTFGLYYPWAKVRKLRYFLGNTHVDGHAMDFHGQPSPSPSWSGPSPLLLPVACQPDPSGRRTVNGP